MLADWNGLAIAALARAAAVFDRPDWLDPRRAGVRFRAGQLAGPDGRVQHAWRLGRVTAAGLLDDQATMARAAAGAARSHRRSAPGWTQAIRLAEAALAHFGDGVGGFFTTADDATDVPLARPRTAADNATPAGNGLMAEVFARLWHLTGDAVWRERAEALLRAFTGNPDQLAAMPTLLAAADLLEEAATVVVTGSSVGIPPSTPEQPLSPEQPSFRRKREFSLSGVLIATALAAPDPATVVLRASDALSASHPAYGKTAGPSGAAAYVCRFNVCGLPVSDPAVLIATLSARR